MEDSFLPSLPSEVFSPTEKVFSVSFNQNHSNFATGTTRGLRLFRTYPFEMLYSLKVPSGCCLVEMLYSSNILIYVANGNRTKVTIWDMSTE